MRNCCCGGKLEKCCRRCLSCCCFAGGKRRNCGSFCNSFSWSAGGTSLYRRSQSTPCPRGCGGRCAGRTACCLGAVACFSCGPRQMDAGAKPVSAIPTANAVASQPVLFFPRLMSHPFTASPCPDPAPRPDRRVLRSRHTGHGSVPYPAGRPPPCRAPELQLPAPPEGALCFS